MNTTIHVLLVDITRYQQISLAGVAPNKPAAEGSLPMPHPAISTEEISQPAGKGRRRMNPQPEAFAPKIADETLADLRQRPARTRLPDQAPGDPLGLRHQCRVSARPAR